VEMGQAVLPQAVFLPVWVNLSWALVVSAVLLRLTSRLKASLWVATVMGVVMLLPHIPMSGYLALAFQTPSLLLVMWALLQLKKVILKEDRVSESLPLIFPVLGILLGWMLVFDTLNFWPSFLNFNLYAFGFEAGALWSVLFVAVLLLMVSEIPPHQMLIFLLTLALFSIFRLPTGNIWDAVLDPFIWIICHAVLLRRLYVIYF